MFLLGLTSALYCVPDILSDTEYTESQDLIGTPDCSTDSCSKAIVSTVGFLRSKALQYSRKWVKMALRYTCLQITPVKGFPPRVVLLGGGGAFRISRRSMFHWE